MGEWIRHRGGPCGPCERLGGAGPGTGDLADRPGECAVDRACGPARQVVREAFGSPAARGRKGGLRPPPAGDLGRVEPPRNDKRGGRCRPPLLPAWMSSCDYFTVTVLLLEPTVTRY